MPFCLKVRLVAPLEVRLERHYGPGKPVPGGAEGLTARVDRDRACYLQANYEKAWDEEGSYDVVLNTGSLSYDQAVELSH